MRTFTTALAGLSLAISTADTQVPSDPRLLRPASYELAITVDLAEQQIDGMARIRLRNEHPEPVGEASLLLYRLLSVRAVRDSTGRPVQFQQSVVTFEDFTKLQVNHLRVALVPALGAGQETVLEIHYAGHVLGYAETGMAYIRDRVDTAYTLLREDSYAYPVVGYPSIRVRRRAGLPEYSYVARITVPATHSVANGGRLVERIEEGATTTFVYASAKPSWRMDFGIAPFGALRRGNLTVFHMAADSAGAGRIMDAMERTLGLYTRWFGPLRGDSPFAVIEIPDGWGSQADATSILQAAAAFRDPKREDELYHEISHLWNVRDTEGQSPRWNEGLATFLEDLATDSLYARATMDSTAIRYARWLSGRVQADSSLHTVPPADYGARNMTDWSYSVGSLMFYSLYRLVGHDAFSRIIGNFYRQYAGTGANTADFVRLAKQTSRTDLTAFFDDWLYSTRWTEVVSSAETSRDLYARYQP
ncbi:MAG: hypothetical protein NUW01_17035 [Gemmatimonadaceae bacterium]|nr:hypothetical protein [Gemmatimonadaceae bacterium]